MSLYVQTKVQHVPVWVTDLNRNRRGPGIIMGGAAEVDMNRVMYGVYMEFFQFFFWFLIYN